MNKKMCSQQCCFSNLLGRAEKSAQGEYKLSFSECTDKKENKIVHIYKEILLIYEEMRLI